MERREESGADVSISDLDRNDVPGAMGVWLRELRVGRSCYETTNMLLHLQDDPDELLAAMTAAADAEKLEANPFPFDDSELMAVLAT